MVRVIYWEIFMTMHLESDMVIIAIELTSEEYSYEYISNIMHSIGSGGHSVGDVSNLKNLRMIEKQSTLWYFEVRMILSDSFCLSDQSANFFKFLFNNRCKLKKLRNLGVNAILRVSVSTKEMYLSNFIDSKLINLLPNFVNGVNVSIF